MKEGGAENGGSVCGTAVLTRNRFGAKEIGNNRRRKIRKIDDREHRGNDREKQYEKEREIYRDTLN